MQSPILKCLRVPGLAMTDDRDTLVLIEYNSFIHKFFFFPFLRKKKENRHKVRKSKIISSDENKNLKKIQFPFLIKVLKKDEAEVIYLMVIKAIHDSPTAIIMLNGG